MRLITNMELCFISGGADEDEIQKVEITGNRMGFFEKFWFDILDAFSGTSNGMTQNDWDILQTAYVVANETGHSVEVEISGPEYLSELNIEVAKVGAKSGGTKYKVTVDPADCYRRN